VRKKTNVVKIMSSSEVTVRGSLSFDVIGTPPFINIIIKINRHFKTLN